MKAEKISISLPGTDGKTHSFDLVERDGQLFFEVAGGVVATLSAATMTKDVPDAEGDYHTKMSNNFYLQFHAVDPVAKADCAACCWVEPAGCKNG